MKRNVSIVTVNKEKATALLEKNTYPGQRPCRSERVDELGKDYELGLFLTGHVAVAHVNGSSYMLNGQHQCAMVVDKDAIVDCMFEEFWCDDKNQVAQLFSQYDDGNSRTAAQVAGAFAASIGAPWSKSCTATCASALAFLRWGPTFSGESKKDERGQLLASYRTACDFIYEVLYCAGKNSTFMHRIPIVAASIASFLKSEDHAAVFWSAVRDGDMLKDTDPAFTIREFLKSPMLPGHQLLKATRGLGKLTPAERSRMIHVKCLHAWNAYRNGTTTDLKYYSNSPIPEVM